MLLESQRSEVKVFYSRYHQTQLKTIQHPSYIISRVVIFFGFLFSDVFPNFREHIFLVHTSISALFFLNIAHIYKIMKKSNYVVWPAPSSKFLQSRQSSIISIYIDNRSLSSSLTLSSFQFNFNIFDSAPQ